MISYRYDAQGRVITEMDYVNSTRHEFFYNTANNLTSTNTIRGATFSHTAFGYNVAQRVNRVYVFCSVQSWQRHAASYTYDANGNRTSVTLANGVRTDYTFNLANQVTSVVNRNGNTILSRFDYTHFLNGNVHRVVEQYQDWSLNRTVTFHYDNAGRLQQESAVGTGHATMTRIFIYDRRGNRVQMQEFDHLNRHSLTTYEYDLNNRLLRETRTGFNPRTTVYTYDNNGNQLTSTTGGSVERRYYDAFNQMRHYYRPGISGYYTNRADGLRNFRRVNGFSIGYSILGGQVVMEWAEYGARLFNLFYFSLPTNHLIMSHHHGWYLFNGRGDVVQRTNNLGQVIQTYRYDAFGNLVVPDDINDGPTFPGANNNPFRFTGQYYDWERGEYHLRARSYNPRLGRFTSQDPHWGIHNMIFGDSPTLWNDRYVPSIHAIMQASNLFVYVMNNPLVWVDPSGLSATTNLQDKCKHVMEGGKSKGGSAGVSAGGSGARRITIPRIPRPNVRVVFRARLVSKPAATPGRLTGNTAGMTADERRVVNDLLERGSNVEIIPRSPTEPRFDFRVDGVATELKTLHNLNINTGITKIQRGFAQNNPSVVIIDARGTGLIDIQAQEIINRAAGSFSGGQLPGEVQIWIDNAIIIGR